MSEQLGKIEKPEAEQFKQKRKLYLIPLIFCNDQAPPEYSEKYKLYWAQVSQHLVNLEEKIGKVNHVYHESISLGDDEGLKVMEKLNPSSYAVAKEKFQNGAVLEATEDHEMAAESADWERFILIGFFSQRVADLATELYVEATHKRYKHIGKHINETLKPDEVGLLFIREGHIVQFPPDIEVFSVSPPALDDIHRWQRERSTEKRSEQ